MSCRLSDFGVRIGKACIRCRVEPVSLLPASCVSSPSLPAARRTAARTVTRAQSLGWPSLGPWLTQQHAHRSQVDDMAISALFTQVWDPTNMDYNPTRWPQSPPIVMRCAPWASNGPNHLGLCALQLDTNGDGQVRVASARCRHSGYWRWRQCSHSALLSAAAAPLLYLGLSCGIHGGPADCCSRVGWPASIVLAAATCGRHSHTLATRPQQWCSGRLSSAVPDLGGGRRALM